MKPRPESSLGRRAMRAVALWAGFYLLAFGLAGGLLYGAISVFPSMRNAAPLASVLCSALAGLGALVILGSSFPRWQRFQPPGPRLDPKAQPRLFEEIRRVARDTRQKPPAEVYLVFDVNAGVGQRGRFLGLFSRRFMTVGLPLLKILTVSQFRSVLAHEFGHYVGGDTRLGPWVYKTHAAIQRTLEALEGADSIWRFPFIAYGRLFTRISLEISQRQELAADALAARVAGKRACAEALRRIEAGAAAFPAFVNAELLPVIDARHRPPLCEGFARFLGAKDVSRAVMRCIGRSLANRKRNPHGTHPPLSQRIEAIGALFPEADVPHDPPAIDLLSDLDRVEKGLLISVFGKPRVDPHPPVSWDVVGEQVFLPQWRERVQFVRPHLTGITPASFPDLPLTDIGRRIQGAAGHRPAAEETGADARGVAMNDLGAALLVALCDAGWAVRVEPGERPALVQGGDRVEPFHVFVDLAEGKVRPETWRARCEAGGFGGIDLGAEVPPSPAAPGATPDASS